MSKKKENEEEVLVDVQEVYSKTEHFLEENKKGLTVFMVLVFVLFGGYYAFKNLYQAPLEKEASELIWKAEYYMEIDSLDLAVDGDGNYFGLNYIADEYAHTATGNLATYYLGTIYLKKGEYALAIDYLNDVSFDDEIVGATCIGAIGDAYVELGNYKKAASNFKKAIAHSTNDFTTPIYLMKEALVEEQLGNFDDALDNYKRIQNDFPNSSQARDIEKYISKASAYIG
jgi:tetratricopeptide (TPR) repeat protein